MQLLLDSGVIITYIQQHNDRKYDMIIQSRGPWVATRSGAAYYLNDPRPADFNLSDMAAGISKDCRFCGQLSEAFDDDIYSVAQHSVYVDMLVALMGVPEARPWAIMHDAVEGMYGDMTSPQKAITPQYAEREDRAQAALIKRYNIPYDAQIIDVVNRADKMLSAMEADVMTTTGSSKWAMDYRPIMTLHELDPDFHCWRPRKSRETFLAAVVAQLGTSVL